MDGSARAASRRLSHIFSPRHFEGRISLIKCDIFKQIDERANCQGGKSDSNLSVRMFFAWFGIGKAEATRMQHELHFLQKSFQPVISHVFRIFCKHRVSHEFLTAIGEIGLAWQPPMRSRSVGRRYLEGGWRNAKGRCGGIWQESEKIHDGMPHTLAMAMSGCGFNRFAHSAGPGPSKLFLNFSNFSENQEPLKPSMFDASRPRDHGIQILLIYSSRACKRTGPVTLEEFLEN